MKRISSVLLPATALLLAGSLASAQTKVEDTAPITSPPEAVDTATIGPAAKAAVTTIETVCMPVLRRASLAKTAESAGFRHKGGEWRLDLPQRARIDLQPPDAANPNVCGQTILSPACAGAGLRLALANWARAQGLKPVQFDVASKGFQYDRTTSTWSGQATHARRASSSARKRPSPASQSTGPSTNQSCL